MPYLNDPTNPLDYLMAPFKVLGGPWGAIQTGIAGGDWQEALADPDKAIRGRQFLEQMGWASPDSGIGADIAGTAVDMVDPISWMAMGGLGKGLQALRGGAKVAEAAAPAATGMSRFIPGWGTTAAMASPLAGSAVLGANQRSDNPSDAMNVLGSGLMVAPMVHGGYNLAKGLAGFGRGKAIGVVGAVAEPPVPEPVNLGRPPQQTNALVPYRTLTAPTAPSEGVMPVGTPPLQQMTGLPQGPTIELPAPPSSFYSRLQRAAETLPENIKAESLVNALKRAPEGVHSEELDHWLANNGLPTKGVISKQQVLDSIEQNGIKVERRVFDGRSQEGSIAKAAREKYLAAEAEYQQALQTFRATGANENDVWKLGTADKDPQKIGTPEYQQFDAVRQAKEAAYAEQNATAGKSNELIAAEMEKKAAWDKVNSILHEKHSGMLRRPGGGAETDPEWLAAQKYGQDMNKKVQLLRGASRPKYETYTTPGGVEGTYQEHIFKLPEHSEVAKLRPEYEAALKAADEYKADTANFRNGSPQQKRFEQAADDFEKAKAAHPSYNEPHWNSNNENLNTFAHWRGKEHVGPNGERVLHVDEVQSQLHQTGKKWGYFQQFPVDVNKTFGEQGFELFQEKNGTPNEWGVRNKSNPEAVAILGVSKANAQFALTHQKPETSTIKTGQVPNLPFKDNEWANYVLKDIIDHAVKNGYDAVSFNNGVLAKHYSAGGGGKLEGLQDWYERQIPARMKKLFGLKNDPHEIDVPARYVGNDADSFPEGEPEYASKHTIPFFRIDRSNYAGGGGTLRNKVLTKGFPQMSLLPFLAAAGTGAAATVGAQRMPWEREQ